MGLSNLINPPPEYKPNMLFKLRVKYTYFTANILALLKGAPGSLDSIQVRVKGSDSDKLTLRKGFLLHNTDLRQSTSIEIDHYLSSLHCG